MTDDLPRVPRFGRPWSAAAAGREFRPTHAAHRAVEAHPITFVSPDLVIVEAWGEDLPLPIRLLATSAGTPIPGDLLIRGAPTRAEPGGPIAWCRAETFADEYRPLPPPGVDDDLGVIFDALRARLVALGTPGEQTVSLTMLDGLRAWIGVLTAETRSPASPQSRADDEATPASGVA